MSTLRNLWEGTNSQQAKHASGGVGSEWENAAQMFGFANGEDLMDKVATAHVVNQVAMTKYANGQILMGEAMAAGYWDTMTKIASANAVRDGIPQEYIDIAKASRQALADHFVKVASAGDVGMFKKLVEQLQRGGAYLKDKGMQAGQAIGDNFKQGYESAKQVLGKGRYGASSEAGAAASMAKGDLGLKGATTIGGAPRVGELAPELNRGVQNALAGPEVARYAKELGVDAADLGFALRGRGQAAADAALRLGVPAAGVAGLAGGAYAMS